MKRFIAIVLLVLSLSSCASTKQKVTLVAHDSFAISDELIAEFEKSSGYELEVVRAGDVGGMSSSGKRNVQIPCSNFSWVSFFIHTL